jgi:hypothetical protein
MSEPSVSQVASDKKTLAAYEDELETSTRFNEETKLYNRNKIGYPVGGVVLLIASVAAFLGMLYTNNQATSRDARPFGDLAFFVIIIGGILVGPALMWSVAIEKNEKDYSKVKENAQAFINERRGTIDPIKERMASYPALYK